MDADLGCISVYINQDARGWSKLYGREHLCLRGHQSSDYNRWKAAECCRYPLHGDSSLLESPEVNKKFHMRWGLNLPLHEGLPNLWPSAQLQSSTHHSSFLYYSVDTLYFFMAFRGDVRLHIYLFTTHFHDKFINMSGLGTGMFCSLLGLDQCLAFW